jgi:hypothetical protein
MTKHELYTLCLEGTPIAICALERNALRQNEQQVIRDAFFKTWQFAGGDLMRLVGHDMVARAPTEEEGKLWDDVARATGKPFVVLAGGGEARGTA